MKRLRITLLALLLIGSDGSGPGLFASGAAPGELYRLMTDRSIYVAGEEVRIRVFNLNPEVLRVENWSSVYYLELISPDGNPFSRAKFPLADSGASGLLEIPDNIPSGTYFLKGYTRWMRNVGAPSFQYLSLEIINPRNRKVMQADTSAPDQLVMHRPSPCFSAGGPLAGALEGSTGRRELITLKLSGERGSTLRDCCITVARKGTLEKQWENARSATRTEPESSGFLPETQGVTLTGLVNERITENPAPYSIVYLSALGSENEFYATHSDSSGRFYFSLREGTGEQEYFISASREDQAELDLLVDQDYSTERPGLPSFPLETVHRDPDLVSELSLNLQIREQYQMEAAESPPGNKAQARYFYGRAQAVIRFDDFIRLPDLEEYFREVIPQVSIRKSAGIRSFRVHGEHPDLQFYSPLVMVDGVAIFDVESVLSIDPRYVERIEIIMSPYIRGNVTFGGIIHLVSRTGNMGYIDLPSSGLLLSYQKFSEQGEEVPAMGPGDAHLPDTRNTIFWAPSLVLRPGESREISFRAPDQPGTYQILIRGYGPNLECHEERIEFRVEQDQLFAR